MFNKEPAVFFKIIEEVFRAAIPVALIFGFIHWTEAQTGAVMLFVGVLVGGLTVLFTRSQVMPVDTANTQIRLAVKMPADSTLDDVKRAAEEKMQREEDRQ